MVVEEIFAEPVLAVGSIKDIRAMIWGRPAELQAPKFGARCRPHPHLQL